MILKESHIVTFAERYHAFNQLKTERCLAIMPADKRPLFDVLTFLLCVNHPKLPGYMHHPEVPYGIFGYHPSDATLEGILKFLGDRLPQQERSVGKLREFIHNEAAVKSLLLMGSVGSIAQSAGSDFDYWACVFADKLGALGCSLLAQKFALVEQWADEAYDLEVHFFLTDINKVRVNDFGPAGGESAGSSQAALLKEEFYRTCLHVAGKKPLWWILPPFITHDAHARCKELIKRSQKIPHEQYLDLGHLNDISRDEFYGAAIWQINKAIESPYKSVIKMAILSVYLNQNKTSQILCNFLKKRVHDGFYRQPDPTIVDPYALLVETVIGYYEHIGDKFTADLMKTCIYIKSGVKVQKDFMYRGDLSFKEKAMGKYVEKWGWSWELVDKLNHYQNWHFDTVCNLGQRTHQYLLTTFQELSKHLKMRGTDGPLITPNDLTILARKLETFYATKPNKIGFLKKAFKKGLEQQNVSFVAEKKHSGQIIWHMFRGTVTGGFNHIQPERFQQDLVKAGRSLEELLVWAIHNGIILGDTTIHLAPGPVAVMASDLLALRDQMIGEFALGKGINIPSKDCLTAAKRTHMLIVANLTVPKQTTQLSSVAIVSYTTWGEFYCHWDNTNATATLAKFITELSQPEAVQLRSGASIFTPANSNRLVANQVRQLLNANKPTLDQHLAG